MDYFKELVQSLVEHYLSVKPDPSLEQELHEFMDSPMKIFEAKSESPGHSMLAAAFLPKYYPQVGKTFREMLAAGQSINLEEEELLYDKGTSMES